MTQLKKEFKLYKTDDPLIRNLRFLMEKADLSEADLARKTFIPQSTLHKILSGFTADPRISNLQLIAKYFGITLDSLLQENMQLEPGQERDSVSLPVISWKECLDNTLALTSRNHDAWVVVERDATTGRRSFGLSSKPSMEPRFPRGTILIVNPEVPPVDGDLVVVRYPATDEATLRELFIDGPLRKLLGINDNIENDTYNDDIEVIGVVTQSKVFYQK